MDTTGIFCFSTYEFPHYCSPCRTTKLEHVVSFTICAKVRYVFFKAPFSIPTYTIFRSIFRGITSLSVPALAIFFSRRSPTFNASAHPYAIVHPPLRGSIASTLLSAPNAMAFNSTSTPVPVVVRHRLSVISRHVSPTGIALRCRWDPGGAIEKLLLYTLGYAVDIPRSSPAGNESLVHANYPCAKPVLAYMYICVRYPMVSEWYGACSVTLSLCLSPRLALHWLLCHVFGDRKKEEEHIHEKYVDATHPPPSPGQKTAPAHPLEGPILEFTAVISSAFSVSSL